LTTVSVVIVNWNTKDLLLDCLASVFNTMNGMDFEVWVVDNGSQDGSTEAVRRDYPTVKVIENEENLGFAAANNKAFRRMHGRYALLLNTDAVLTEGAVEELYSFMERHRDVGMACGQLLNEDGSRQNSIANFPTLLSLLCNETLLRILLPRQYPSKRKTYKKPIQVESCIGACLIVRKKAMDTIGLLDERYFFFFEETDWAYRMKQSEWKVCFVPSSRIFHLQGQSVGHSLKSRIMFFRSRYLFIRKWYRRLFPLIYLAVFVRLLVNACLNLVGVVGTLGLHAGLKGRLSIYTSLIGWHLRGFPEER
jgi:GT2 family glycosyltransferase